MDEEDGVDRGGHANAKAYPYHGRTRFLYGAISMATWGVYVYLSWLLIDHGGTMSYVSLPILGSIWQLGLCGHWLSFESLEARAREEREREDREREEEEARSRNKNGKMSRSRAQTVLRRTLISRLMKKEEEEEERRRGGGRAQPPAKPSLIGTPSHRAPRSHAICWVYPFSYTACYVFSILIWAVLWIHEEVFGEAFVRPPWVFFTVNATIAFPLSLALCPLYVWRG